MIQASRAASAAGFKEAIRRSDGSKKPSLLCFVRFGRIMGVMVALSVTIALVKWAFRKVTGEPAE